MCEVFIPDNVKREIRSRHDNLITYKVCLTQLVLRFGYYNLPLHECYVASLKISGRVILLDTSCQSRLAHDAAPCKHHFRHVDHGMYFKTRVFAKGLCPTPFVCTGRCVLVVCMFIIEFAPIKKMSKAFAMKHTYIICKLSSSMFHHK